MTPAFPVRTAADLMADADFEARWKERESIGAPARAALRDILARFVADGGPIEVASLPHPADVVAELDARDLVYVQDGRVVELTEEGERAFLRLRDAAMAFDRRLRAGISDRELRGLKALLDRMTANADGGRGGDIMVTAAPGGSSAPTSGVNGGMSIAVTTKSQHPDEALKLALWMASQPTAIRTTRPAAP